MRLDVLIREKIFGKNKDKLRNKSALRLNIVKNENLSFSNNDDDNYFDKDNYETNFNKNISTSFVKRKIKIKNNH